MDAPAANLEATLDALATLGMRAATVVTRMMELEQAAAEAAATYLPVPGTTAASFSEAIATGQGFDTAAAAMAQAVPRIEILARAVDRLSRSVRRTVALIRRLQAGWPRAAADDRPAMVRRQVARGVADTIRREADTETAERLFDDLAERLDDPGLAEEIQALPVDEVVRRICRDLGLTTRAPPHVEPPHPPPSPAPAGRSGRGKSATTPKPPA